MARAPRNPALSRTRKASSKNMPWKTVGDDLAMTPATSMSQLKAIPRSSNRAPPVRRPALLETKGAKYEESFLAEKLGGGLVESTPGKASGEIARGIAGPYANEAGLSPEAVIGPTEDRIAIPDTTRIPWSALCRINTTLHDGRTIAGTGFFIGPKCVLTAGHVIIDIQSGALPKTISVTPGKNGARRPFGDYMTVRWVAPETFVQKQDRDHDLAVLFLEGNPGDRVGYFGFGAFENQDLDKVLVNVAGYPNNLGEFLYTAHGRILATTSTALIHAVDTTAGQSGAPVFYRDDSGQRVVLGIHAYGDDARGSNFATRITPDIKAWLTDLARSA